MLDVKINGLDGALSDLDDVPKVTREALPRALGAAGEVMRAEVARRTPVGRGELRAALRTRVSVDRQGGTAVVDFGKQNRIANWVEYGHRMVTHNNKQVGRVRMHPFVRPAADVAQDRAIRAFEDELFNE